MLLKQSRALPTVLLAAHTVGLFLWEIHKCVSLSSSLLAQIALSVASPNISGTLETIVQKTISDGQTHKERVYFQIAIALFTANELIAMTFEH